MIALGTHVVYHHRAAVARYRNDRTNPHWELTEGLPDDGLDLETFIHRSAMFEKFPEQKRGRYQINKTVMVWPETGSGVLIGKIRKQRGTSHRGHGSYEDYEPGYFDPIETFSLYVVKWELAGMKYIYTPMWATLPERLRRG